jgi:glycosyltransferase involved in cell wall biosynthesis
MVTVQHCAKDDRIFFKQAISLAQAGYKVHILSISEDGKPKDMSGKSVNTSEIKAISYVTLKQPTSLISTFLKKLYLGPFYKRTVRAASAIKADIYVAHEPQSLMIVRKAAKKLGSKYLFDAHESLYFNNWKDRWALKKEMNRLVAFTTANSLTQKALLKLNPKAESEVIYNASVLEQVASPSPKDLLIVHEGSFPFNRGLELLMEALALLKKEYPLFNLKIIGSLGDAEQNYFVHMVRTHHLEERIELTGWVPYEDLDNQLSGGAIGLILNTPTPNNLYGGPANKLFNYISKSLMVIAVDLPETTQILNSYSCGVVLEDRSPETLAHVLEKALTDENWRMSYRDASNEAASLLSWKKESQKLVAFYNKLLQ